METMREGHERRSLVEEKRQEAFARMCDELEERLTHDIGRKFEVNGRHYELTSAEDCMVAYAQQMRAEVQKLYEEVLTKDDYYEEKAIAKLLELFRAYERLVSLYAELRSYYPDAAGRVEAHVPSLQETAKHGEALWDTITQN
jgi:hypothetical protein